MKTTDKRVSLYLLGAGLAAAVCWTIADVLLVGFAPRLADYPLFNNTLHGQLDGELAVLMLEGSPQRLLWGVLPATFSVVLYWSAVWGVYRLFARGRMAVLCAALLCCGYALSPPAHAGFFYLGISAQTLLHGSGDDVALHVAQFNLFYRILLIHWIAAILFSAVGWLLLLVQTWRGQTTLPRHAVLFNPLPLALIIGILCGFFPNSVLAASVGGASINLAQAVFFATTLRYARQHPRG